MKARIILGLGILCALGSQGRGQGAPSNQTINIQGVLRNGAGALQSAAFGLDVNLFSVQMGGTAFFTQHFPTVPVESGYFSVELSGPALKFAGPDAWAEVQISGDSAPLPRQHIASVPYAFSAASLDTTACSGCVQDGMIAAVSASKVTGVLPVANGGTGSSTLNIHAVATPADVSGIGNVEVTVASVSGTWTGLPVFIYGNGNIYNAQNAFNNMTFKIRLDNAATGTILRALLTTSNGFSSFGLLPLAILTTYVPSPGAHTFYLTASSNPGAGAAVGSIEFGAVELLAK
jgi:hypothetical protein